MKHKKFVKQLMSLGLDRNGAEMCAAYSRRKREPYADGLARFQRILKNVEAVMQAPAFEFNTIPGGCTVVKCDTMEEAREILDRLMLEPVGGVAS